ncbi:hypothetical protein [Xylanimonas sp. McL0601]|uniref:hypothetical protein n=1 Tax=Xylanimonas sp. McL0601 TaxID=3414739 RepID=UPI003CE87C0D
MTWKMYVLSAPEATAGWNLPSWFGWSAITFSLLLAGIGVAVAFRAWRDPKYVERTAEGMAVLRPHTGRAGARALVPTALLSAGIGVFFSAFLVARWPGVGDVVPIVIGIFGAVILVIAGVLILSIMYYNKPQFLVPPSMRADDGMAELRRRHEGDREKLE